MDVCWERSVEFLVSWLATSGSTYVLNPFTPIAGVIAGYDNRVFSHSLQENFALMKKGKKNWILHFGAVEL